MNFIFEYKPKSGILVIFPSLILFTNGSDKSSMGGTDLTLSWIFFGLTLRFNK